MNTPETVRILGGDYTVITEQRLNNGSHLLCGQIDYERHTIKIEPDVTDEQRKHQTLLHEIIHGIAHEMGFSLKEEKVDKLATGIYAVIKDNPGMFSGNA
jgi:hypothetical protein